MTSLATLCLYLSDSCPYCRTFKPFFQDIILPKLTQMFGDQLQIKYNPKDDAQIRTVPRMDFISRLSCGDVRIEFPHGRFVNRKQYSLMDKEDVFFFISQLFSNSRLACQISTKEGENEKYELCFSSRLNSNGAELFDQLMK